MAESEAAILIMKAAADLRKAAGLDKKRRAELASVADYLESIFYEAELGYGEPLFPEADRPLTPEDEIRKMIKPFRVRLKSLIGADPAPYLLVDSLRSYRIVSRRRAGAAAWGVEASSMAESAL